MESKSLKLFLGAFRSHGAFHEDCTLAIAKRLELRSSRCGSGSAATGTRAAACRSTCFTSRRPDGLWLPDAAVSGAGLGTCDRTWTEGITAMPASRM